MSPAVAPVTLVKRRTKALQAHLPAALEGDAHALHGARVASRRLREVLPLSTAGHATKKRVRRLTQWLGRVREMDVALALLDVDDLTDGVPRLALAEARQHLQLAREKRRGCMLRRLQKLSPRKLDRTLAKLIEVSAEQDVAAWRRALAARLARRASALRRATEKAGAIYVAERLHGVRIAAKKLRYALEIAAELGTRDAAKLAAVVRRTQITLGNLQDRNILLRQVREASAHADDITRQGLAVLAADLEQACREIHGEFLGQREALDAALLAVRQHIVPELAHAARRRTPLRTTTHGQSDRALSDSTRLRRAARRGVA